MILIAERIGRYIQTLFAWKPIHQEYAPGGPSLWPEEPTGGASCRLCGQLIVRGRVGIAFEMFSVLAGTAGNLSRPTCHMHARCPRDVDVEPPN